MTRTVTAEDVANAVRNFNVTTDEAAKLIQSYAEAFASGEVIKALEKQHARNMAILETPLIRRAPDA